MTDPVVSNGLANLPAISTSTPPVSFPLLQGWLQGPARWAGWLVLALVPVFIFSAIGVLEVSAAPCYNYDYDYFDRLRYDQGCLRTASLTMGVISMVCVLLAGLFLASAVAVLKRPRSLLGGSAAGRLQGIKDWFIRGDIQEDDYQRLRALIERADDSGSLGMLARRGATLLRASAFLLVPLGIFWAIFIGIFTDELGFVVNESSIFLNWLIGGPLLAILFVAALVRASQLGRFSKAFGQVILQQVDAAEEQVMRAARARAGAREPVPAVSYKPYARR